MTRMTGPDCVVMCNLINTYIPHYTLIYTTPHYTKSRIIYQCVCCVVFPFILDVRLLDVPVGVVQEEGHTGFLIHLPSAVLALIFLARRTQPSLSLVDRSFFCVLTN